MAAASAGHEQTCQSLVLLSLRTSALGGSWVGSSPRKPQLLQRKGCIYKFLFTTNISLSHCLWHTGISAHCETITSMLKSRSFLSGTSMSYCGLGQNITVEVGKTAIGRLLPLWNVPVHQTKFLSWENCIWYFISSSGHDLCCAFHSLWGLTAAQMFLTALDIWW